MAMEKIFSLAWVFSPAGRAQGMVTHPSPKISQSHVTDSVLAPVRHQSYPVRTHHRLAFPLDSAYSTLQLFVRRFLLATFSHESRSLAAIKAPSLIVTEFELSTREPANRLNLA